MVHIAICQDTKCKTLSLGQIAFAVQADTLMKHVGKTVDAVANSGDAAALGQTSSTQDMVDMNSISNQDKVVSEQVAVDLKVVEL